MTLARREAKSCRNCSPTLILIEASTTQSTLERRQTKLTSIRMQARRKQNIACSNAAVGVLRLPKQEGLKTLSNPRRYRGKVAVIELTLRHVARCSVLRRNSPPLIRHSLPITQTKRFRPMLNRVIDPKIGFRKHYTSQKFFVCEFNLLSQSHSYRSPGWRQTPVSS